jgi:hypothetical protein
MVASTSFGYKYRKEGRSEEREVEMGKSITENE